MSLSDPGLDREAADRALERLGAESDRIAEALVAMDGHPGHQLLRGGTLSGLTERRWAEASVAMATLWEQFDAYRTLLERAREVRARRSRPGQEELAELSALLKGPVVELNEQQVPIEQRGLTGPAVNFERITLTQLVDRMKAGYAAVTKVLAEVDSAWARAMTMLDPLETELRETLALAESVGPDELGALNQLRERMAEARELAVTDPLAVSIESLEGIRTDLAALRGRLAALADTRDSVDERVERISGVLGEIESTLARARAVEIEVVEKILSPGLAEIVDRTPDLRAEVEAAMALRGDWARLAGELGQLDRAVAEALADARAQLGVRTGLLDRRAELRGRLDAYRAKAARLGGAEDLELSKLHTQAYDLLYTRPCDLAAATRAVNRYQQAVQEGPK